MTDTTIDIDGVKIGPDDVRILALWGAIPSHSFDSIATELGQPQVAISKVLTEAEAMDRGDAARLALTWLLRNGGIPGTDATDGISAIIARAIATERPKLVAAADRIADLADDLETQLAEYERSADLQAKAAKLEAELAEIRGQLGTTQPLVVDPKRAWAAAAGVECPRHGRVPGSVVAAYQQAQGSA